MTGFGRTETFARGFRGKGRVLTPSGHSRASAYGKPSGSHCEQLQRESGRVQRQIKSASASICPQLIESIGAPAPLGFFDCLGATHVYGPNNPALLVQRRRRGSRV
jgi:hypothetical protein